MVFHTWCNRHYELFQGGWDPEVVGLLKETTAFGYFSGKLSHFILI